MTLDALAARAVEWAATYAVHSTLLLGIVALSTHRLVRSDAWREVLWRGALLGSVATATLATALPLDPVAGRWNVPGLHAPMAAEAPQSAPAPSATEVSRDGGEAGVPAARTSGELAARPAHRGSDVSAETSPNIAAWLLAAWGAAAALFLLLLAARNARLMRRLRGRERIQSGRLVAMLAELRRLGGVWSPVRLSVSLAAPTPLVIGASEICLPPRFLDGLGEDEQRAALAHELAHVARRDPWWQLGTAILHALLFFQPLHHLARRRLRDAAENLCDDWAVRQTGSPLALGRCLADIASWVSTDPLPHLGSTHAMAEGGSPLLERVRRIADGTAGAPAPKAMPAAATAALLAATLALAPAVTGGGAQAGSTEPAGELAGRWEEAVAAGGEAGFWIGWGIERPAGAGQGMVISSTPGPAGRDGPPLAEVLRAAGVGEVPQIAFLFGFDSEGRGAGDVDWMMIRSADAPADLGGLPLRWLGTSSQEESLAQLAWLYARTPLAEVQAELVAALTLHAPGSETHEAIAAAVAAAPDEEVRAEAADWLTNQDTPADVALLERLAMEDPSPEVRQEAASGLAEFSDPAAVRALLRLARAAPDPRVRSEAVQRLDESRSDEVVDVLASMAFEDPVAAVRLDAVDVLAGMSTVAARAALRRIASDHPDGVVRQAAIQALPTDD